MANSDECLRFSAVVLVAQLIGFATSLHALMGARTAPGTVAWVRIAEYHSLSGRSGLLECLVEAGLMDYVQIRRQRVTSLNELLESHRAELDPFRTEWTDQDPQFRTVEQLAHIPFVDGNHAELLIDGSAIFEEHLRRYRCGRELSAGPVLHRSRRTSGGRELQRRLIRKAT